MRKFLGCFIILLLLPGCMAANLREDNLTTTTTNETVEIMQPEQILIEITLQPELAGDVDPLSSMTKEPRIKGITVNEDESVTYLITKELHEEVKAYFLEQFLQYSQELIGDKENGIIHISYTEDLKEIELEMDHDFDSEESDVIISELKEYAMIYQSYMGFEPLVEVQVIQPRTISCRITIDKGTGTIDLTYDYDGDS